MYTYSKTLTLAGQFGFSTERLYYKNEKIEPVLMNIGKSLGINGFANILFMYCEPEDAHYLIEVDLRPTAWMYYGKFTGHDFSEAVKKISIDDLTLVRVQNAGDLKELKISLYKKDIYRCILEKNMKGLIAWLVNKDKRWQYIPFYDKTLLRAINRFLWNSFKELFINKIKKRLPTLVQK